MKIDQGNLMTLGTKGQRGAGINPQLLNEPERYDRANGDIFVAQGHTPE